MIAYGPNEEILGFDNMRDRAIRGNTEWTRHHVVIDVPEQAEHIAFGLLLVGQGQVWIDDIVLAAVSRQVATTVLPDTADDYPDTPVNLDFEA